MESTGLTVREVVARGYNLMVTAVLVITGTVFALPGLREGEVADRLDDYGLFAVALVALAWYRIGRLRFRRSLVPLGLVLLAMAVQVYGLLVERDDAPAVGDNFNALLILVPLLALAGWEYVRPLRPPPPSR